MKSLGCWKDFNLRPLDGLFDARSPSGEVAFTDYRFVLNLGRSEQKKLCRLGGWQRLLRDSPFGFKNQDLHSQLENCGFYRESFSEEGFFPGGFAGYNYPYFIPSHTEQEVATDQVNSNLYYGYAPDYTPDPYPSGSYEDQWRMCSIFAGYPYAYTQNYAVPNTGSPDFYQLPYFRLCYLTVEDAYTVTGYGYGSPIPVYSKAYGYTYEYCGNYLYNRPGCREAITFLFEAVSVSGRRQLLAGTKSRLLLLNETSGNWRVLADGLGGVYQSDDNCECSARRFKAAQLGNTIIFVNDFDEVLFWNMDSGPSGCNFWSAAFVTDLQGLGITKARAVASWQGFMFVGNVAVNGEVQSSRLLWSDYNAPLDYAPGGESVAGSHDFGKGEAILAIETIGGQLRIYTSRGDEKAIYAASIVGGDEILHFEEIYRGPDGIEYPNSLVNLGNAHVWFGVSGIMWLGEYDRVPTRPEWIHKASGVFYSGVPSNWLESFPGMTGFGPVNREACEQVIGGYDSERKNIWFSWPTQGNDCPNMSLLINPTYGHASLVDHGFTAFLTHRPDYKTSLREFFATYAGCDFGLMDKEGAPYVDPVMGSKPTYLVNSGEDPDALSDPNSLCARVTGLQLEDLCKTCEATNIFVMASAADKTLKEFLPGEYFRERYVDQGLRYECPETAPGDYVEDGYYSVLQGDNYDFKVHENKIINKGIVDFEAELQTSPSLLYFQVCYGSQPGCHVWDDADPRELACITDAEQEAAEAANERPDELPTFNFYREGAYLGWRFYVGGTGGGACFNSVTLSVRKSSGDWK